jgi:hypothetical protein
MATSTALPIIVNIPPGYAALNTEGMDLANLAAWHLQRIGNSGILAAIAEPGSSAPIGSAANPVGIFERPWLQEPPGAVSFDEQNGVAVAAGQLNVTVLEMTVPQGFDGVINYLSNNAAGFTDFSGDLVWQILINNKPVRNFQNIRAQKGTVQQGRAVSPIRIFSGDVIDYTVSSPNAFAGTVICSLNGYFYPSKGVS